MKGNITKTREVLSQYRGDYSLCNKCKICKGNNVHEVEHARFFLNCPSGSYFQFESYFASGRLEMARALSLGEIKVTDQFKHALYTCMECGSCQEHCYSVKQIWPLRVIELLREKGVADGWGLLPEHETILKNLEEKENILGKPQAERDKLITELGVKDAAKEKCKVLLFIGCKYSFTPETKKVLESAVRLLKKAGADVGILGSQELCCGAPLLELGDRDFFEAFAEENIKRINATGAETVVTLCSHCASMLTEEYGSFMDAKPQHITEFVSEALAKGSLKATKAVKGTVAWHDPCRLGRRLKVYDAPRSVLDAIPGITRVEFPRSGHNSLCCGGGGMAAQAYPEFGLAVAKERVFEAEFTKVDKIVTACPWCEEMLRSGVDGRKSNIQVENILTLLDESVGGK
jgi:Fe-S oxidoreductase